MTDRKPTCVACKGAGGGATYTAGTGIVIESNEISADTSVLATKVELADYQPILTEGTGISIDADNVISADIPGDFHIIPHTEYSDCFEPYDVSNRRITVKKDMLIQLMYVGSGLGSASYSLLYLPKGTVIHGDGYITLCNRVAGAPASLTIGTQILLSNNTSKEVYIAYNNVTASNGMITIKTISDVASLPCLDELNTSTSPTNGYRVFTRE